MADQKISQLTELAEGDIATGDFAPIVDTSATETKKFSWSSLRNAIATFYDTATRTLTNKTLTAPVINSPTGLVKGDVGLGNVDNTSDATKNSATATLTNKTIDGNNNTLTVLAASQLSGIAPSTNGGTGNGFTKFTGPTTSEKTFTLPNANATVLTDNAAVTVAQGGTGRATATAYAVLCGGTTSTAAHQSIASVGTSGQVLTSNGAGALPTFQNAATGAAIIGGGTQALTISQATTVYFNPVYPNNSDTTESNWDFPIPKAGTLKNFYVRVKSNTANQACTLTIRKNGADTALTLTVPSSTSGTFSDTSNTVSVAAGDLITIKDVSTTTSGTATLISCSMVLE